MQSRQFKFGLKAVSLALIFSLVVQQSVFGNISDQTNNALPQSAAVASQLTDFATVSDFYFPKTNEKDALSAIKRTQGKVVVYIEDAHGNISAQKNIANAIDLVSKSTGLDEPWIALEGTGTGEIDHKILSAFPHEGIRQKTVDYFLNTGEIDGADYFATLYNQKARLFGVDDNILAQENRQSYRDYLVSKGETEKALSRLRAASDFLKNKIYFGDITFLDASNEKFERGSNHLLKHLNILQELAKKNNISLSQYPHLVGLIQLKTLEAKITQAGLEKDIVEFSKVKGVAHLDSAKIQSLWVKDPHVFDGFSQLKSQAEFLQISNELQGIPIYSEITALTDVLWKKLLNYPEAKDAYAIDQVLKFYKKLFDFSLVPEDFWGYSKDPKKYSLPNLQKKITNYNFILRPKTLRPTAGDFLVLEKNAQFPLHFYNIAEKRNQFLVDHVTDLIKRSPQEKIFFISGGFHRTPITQEFRKRNISYVVLSPKITSSQGAEGYWIRMSGDKSLLDRALDALTFAATSGFSSLPQLIRPDQFQIQASAVKEEQAFVEPSFRAKAVLVLLSFMSLVFNIDPRSQDRLIKTFSARLDKTDQTILTRVRERLVRVARGIVDLVLPTNVYRVSLTPETNLKIADAKSLGSSMIAVDTEKVSQLLSSSNTPIQTFNSFKIQPFQGLNQLTVESFRETVIPALVKTAEASGLKITVNAQRFLFDAILSASPQFKTDLLKVLQGTPQLPDLEFEFNSESPYLFSGCITDKKLVANSAALQSLSNPVAANALFAVVVYGNFFIKTGRAHSILMNNLFYKLMDDYAKAIYETQKKHAAEKKTEAPKEMGYQGENVAKWIDSGVIRFGHDNEEINRLIDTIYNTNKTGYAPGMILDPEYDSRGVLKRGYRLISRLGQGGMGTAWRAIDVANGSDVAIKSPDLSDPRLVVLMAKRFDQEIRTCRKNNKNRHVPEYLLRHAPSIPEIDEMIKRDGEGAIRQYGRIYYVMKYAEGMSFKDLLKTQKLNLTQKLDIFISLVQGIQYAHEEHTIHRDLKPANVGIDTAHDNFAYIYDWGLGRNMDEADSVTRQDFQRLTMQDVPMGTAEYMSPEQSKGDWNSVSYPTDLWSIGIMLYEAVTGDIPFKGISGGATMTLINTQALPAFSITEPKYRNLDMIIIKLLSKDIEDRYQKATDLLEDLKLIRNGKTPKNAFTSRRTPAAPHPAITGDGARRPGSERRARVSTQRIKVAQLDLERQQQNKKMLIWGGGVLGVIGLVVAILYFALRSTPTTPENPDGNKVGVTVPRPDDQAEAKRKLEEQRKAEEAKLLATQQEAARKIQAEVDVLNGISNETDTAVKNIESLLDNMSKALVKMEAESKKAAASIDDTPVMQASAGLVKSEEKGIKGLGGNVDTHLKTLADKLTDLENKVKALQANPKLSDSQKSELEKSLTKVKNYRTLSTLKGKEAKDLIVQADAFVKNADAALEANQNPARKDEIQLDSKIREVQDFVKQFQNVNVKDLEAPANAPGALAKSIEAKGKELVDNLTLLNNALIALGRLSTATENDAKKVQDLEAKTQTSQTELKALIDSIAGLQEPFDKVFNPLNDQVVRFKALVAEAEILAKKDPKFADKLKDLQSEAAKIKAALDTLSTREVAFKTGMANAKLQDLILMQLQSKSYSAQLALTKVKTAWEKASRAKGDLDKMVEDAKVNLLSIRKAAGEDPLTKDKDPKKRDEAVTGWQKKMVDAQADITKKEQDAKNVRVEMQKLISSFEKDAIGNAAQPGFAMELRTLLEQMTKKGMTPKLETDFQALAQKYNINPDEFLASAKKLFETVSLVFETSISTDAISWAWDGQSLNKLSFYNGNTKLEVPNFSILKDGDKACLQALNRDAHSFIFLPSKLNFSANSSFQFDVEFITYQFNSEKNGFRIGLYSETDQNPCMFLLGNGTKFGGLSISKVRNKFNDQSMYVDNHTDIKAAGNLSFGQMTIFSIRKEAGEKVVKLFKDGKEIGIFSDINNGVIRFFLQNVDIDKTPLQTRIYKISIKAKSLGFDRTSTKVSSFFNTDPGFKRLFQYLSIAPPSALRSALPLIVFTSGIKELDALDPTVTYAIMQAMSRGDKFVGVWKDANGKNEKPVFLSKLYAARPDFSVQDIRENLISNNWIIGTTKNFKVHPILISALSNSKELEFFTPNGVKIKVDAELLLQNGVNFGKLIGLIRLLSDAPEKRDELFQKFGFTPFAGGWLVGADFLNLLQKVYAEKLALEKTSISA